MTFPMQIPATQPPAVEPTATVRLHASRSPLATTPAPGELAALIRDAALALGFVRVGFTPVESFESAREALRTWLARDFHGEMAYLASGPDRANAHQLLAAARTLIVVALPYPRPTPLAQLGRKSSLSAEFAHYAHGADYHVVIKDKLRQLADACADAAGRSVLARACVDTAPLLEREAAARAGVGFAAKSTMTIVPGIGTHVLLGELLVDLEVAPDARLEPRCGDCTACLDACPTGAFVSAHVLDARRCIAYLTIELKGAIPRELRALIGNRVFGCDVCQAVCPFNAGKGAERCAPELTTRPEIEAIDLVGLLELTSSGYRKLVKGSALRRTSRTQLARNAAVALGNSGSVEAVAPLIRALDTDPRPLVRGHVAWALGRLGGPGAREALERAARDADAAVAEEAQLALTDLDERRLPSLTLHG
ncbi:MAG TPA: tRNA epoxyqueuosine(34) reductase QueG [Polyangiaceae bacterium]